MFFITPREGKMEVYLGKNPDGSRIVEKYDYVTGTVRGIESSEYVYNNEAIKQWKLKLQDGENIAIITLGYSSGFTRGLINSLLAADLSKPLKFGCYMSGEFNCPSIIQNNDIVKWKFPSTEVPKTEKVKVGSKEVINDERVVAWIIEKVAEINALIPKERIFGVGANGVDSVTGEIYEPLLENETIDPETGLPF